MTKHIRQLIIFLLFLALPLHAQKNTAPDTSVSMPDEPMEELSDIEWLIEHPQAGVIFTIREYDEEAFSWTAKRINYYIYLLRKAHPKLHIAILAHGDEVGSLSLKEASHYEKLHTLIQSWEDQNITTHACGTMAHMLGLDDRSFPNYIDIVPYGPSQVQDYTELGYKHIELELTW